MTLYDDLIRYNTTLAARYGGVVRRLLRWSTIETRWDAAPDVMYREARKAAHHGIVALQLKGTWTDAPR